MRVNNALHLAIAALPGIAVAEVITVTEYPSACAATYTSGSLTTSVPPGSSNPPGYSSRSGSNPSGSSSPPPFTSGTVVVPGPSSSASGPPPAYTSSNVNPQGQCGGTTSFNCYGAPDGPCCSRFGYCGTGPEYCGTGCQPGYGSCDTVSSSSAGLPPSYSSTSASEPPVYSPPTSSPPPVYTSPSTSVPSASAPPPDYSSPSTPFTDETINEGEPFAIQIAPLPSQYRKRQAPSYLDADGYVTSDPDQAVQYVLQDGQISASGGQGQVTADPDDFSVPFAVSTNLGSIRTTFYSSNFSIAWENSAFDNGEAQFYMVPQDNRTRLIALLRGQPDDDFVQVGFTASQVQQEPVVESSSTSVIEATATVDPPVYGNSSQVPPVHGSSSQAPSIETASFTIISSTDVAYSIESPSLVVPQSSTSAYTSTRSTVVSSIVPPVNTFPSDSPPSYTSGPVTSAPFESASTLSVPVASSSALPPIYSSIASSYASSQTSVSSSMASVASSISSAISSAVSSRSSVLESTLSVLPIPTYGQSSASASSSAVPPPYSSPAASSSALSPPPYSASSRSSALPIPASSTRPASPYGSPVACPAANNQYFVSNAGQSYQVRCLCDVNGQDVATSRTAASYVECFDKCDNNSQCTGFSWLGIEGSTNGIGLGDCYLKRSVPMAFTNCGSNAGLLGAIKSAAPSSSVTQISTSRGSSTPSGPQTIVVTPVPASSAASSAPTYGPGPAQSGSSTFVSNTSPTTTDPNAAGLPTYLTLTSPTPVDFGYIDPSDSLIGDDNYGEAVLAQPLRLYSYSSSNVFLSTNGLLTLGSGTAQYDNVVLPTDYFEASAVLAAFWDDLAFKNPSPEPQQGIWWQANSTTFSAEWYLTRSSAAYVFHWRVDYNYATPGVFVATYYSVGNTVDHGDFASVGMQAGTSDADRVGKSYEYRQPGSVTPGMILTFDSNANTITRSRLPGFA